MFFFSLRGITEPRRTMASILSLTVDYLNIHRYYNIIYTRMKDTRYDTDTVSDIRNPRRHYRAASKNIILLHFI